MISVTFLKNRLDSDIYFPYNAFKLKNEERKFGDLKPPALWMEPEFTHLHKDSSI